MKTVPLKEVEKPQAANNNILLLIASGFYSPAIIANEYFY